MKKLDHIEENPPTLRFLDLDQAKAAVTGSLRSAGSRRCYEHAIVEFIDWYCSEPRLRFNKGVVTRLAYEATDSGLLSPEQAAGIRRVKGDKKLGVRMGDWLLAKQARAL